MGSMFRLFVSVVLLVTMVGLGMTLDPDSLRRWRTKPMLVARALIGTSLLVPVVGGLLFRTPLRASISPAVAVATGLMLLCPSGPLMLRQAKKLGGEHHLAALLQVGASLAALVTIPTFTIVWPQLLGIELLGHSVGVDAQSMDLSLMRHIGRVLVLPLIFGVALRCWMPRFADRIQKSIDRLSSGLLVLLMGFVGLEAGPFLFSFVSANANGLLFMALSVLISLAIGEAASVMQSRSHAVTISLVTAMRNPGLALLLATQFADPVRGLRLAILLYVVLAVLISGFPVKIKGLMMS